MALVAGLYSIILPIMFLIIWKFKSRYDVKPFVIGAICFLVSALVIESLFHSLVLGIDSPISRAINNSVFLYVLYGCLAAGIFEETGRLIGFKYFLKHDNKKEASIMYGIGHGGIEAIMLVGVTFVLYWAIMKGFINVDATTEMQLKPILSSLTSFQCLMSMIERTYAIVVHIALSILVFISVHKKKKSLFFLAILLHALFNIPAALYQRSILGLLTVEIIGIIFAILILVLAINLYKSYKNEEEDI